MRILLVAVAAVLAGATAARAEPSAPAHPAVTACTMTETRAALVSFVRAFNGGDYARLSALFAAPEWFRWYSSGTPGARFDPVAQRRDTLINYFRGRHAHGDRIKLTSFRFNGNSNGYGNFSWKLERSAADFRDGAWFMTEAKGAVLCQGPIAQFIVVSVGSPEP